MTLGRRVLVFASAVVLALGLPTLSRAQSLTGTLSGAVVDAQGGVLPGADVVLTNQESKTVQRTVTNTDGLFVFAAVPAGTYSVRVELSGFTAWEASDIVLLLGQRRSVTATLKVGGVTEVISVTSRPDIAPIDSGEKSARLTAEQIQNVPMVGRSTGELLKLLPGMTPISGSTSNNPGYNGEVIGINGNGDGGKQSAVGNFSGNGTRADALDIVIDGAHASDPGCNCAMSVNPNPDMVGEFKVLQSNYGAEHAKGPITIDVISKAGGRDFHGTGYIYLRDYRWNSNEWRLNKASVGVEGAENKPKNKYAYPGFNIGGPLLIPGTSFNKDRNKVFFFTGYEFYKQRLDTGILQSWVPTDAQLNGDFSNAGSLAGLSNSYVSTMPNNLVNGRIPAGQIDPSGQALLRLLPRPNADPSVTGGYNYFDSVELDQNMQQWLTRVDVNVSDNTRIFARYNLQAETQNFPVGLWWRNANQVPYPTAVTAPNRSHSTTVSLTHIFGPTLTSESTFGATYIDFPNQFEDPSKVSRSALGYTNPGIYKAGLDQIPSLTGWGNGPTMFNPGGFDPVLFAKKWLISGAENVTKVQGAHTIKGGFYYEWVNNSQPGNGNSNGVLSFSAGSANSTGNFFADALTGRLNDYGEQSPNIVRDMAYNIAEFYVQDSWKASNRLTVEGGLRLSHLGGWYEREGVGMAVFDPALYSSQAPGTSFRGLTWTDIDSSVPTSGVEVQGLFWAPRVGFAYDLSGNGETLIRGGYGVFNFHDAQGPYSGFIDLPYGVTSTSVGGSPLLSSIPSVNPNTQPGISGAILATDDQQPRTQSWSLTLQRRLPYQMVVEAGYVGSKSDRLLNDGINNLNVVPLGAMVNDPNGDPNNYRPYPEYGGSLPITQHTHYQNYNALQTLISRSSSKFAFTAAYTFSKALGIRGGGQGSTTQPAGDIRDSAYGVLGYDRRHVMNIGYSYLFPTLDDAAAMKRALLGGWQFTGVSTFISGAPLQPLASTGVNFGLAGTAANGDPIANSTFLTGSPDIAAMPVLTCDPREGSSGDRILNGACFALPAAGSNGNYITPDMRGPGYQNHDFAVFKNFPMGGSRKFQFRASFTNVFNHPQRFLDDNTNLKLQYTNGQLSNTQFGVLPRDNKYGRRIVQLAFKMYF
jgi:carboxypeptidase family protein